jgi:predicted fused transcriptional regulator/phosphomethylpyrimidine kinase/predicted transcriptional regulator
MRFAEEVVVEEVLPSLRALLIEALAQEGLPQQRIAALVGLSQAAVSKYQARRVQTDPRLLRDARARSVTQEVARGLASQSMSALEALARMQGLVRAWEYRGLVCNLHERAMPALQGLGCDLCVLGERSRILEEQEVLDNLRLAVRALEQQEGFASLLPNVGSNLAMARRDARDVLDVAAVPGRMYEVRGSVRVPGQPEFGASRHVADVLLGAHDAFPSVRAAINLRNGADVQAALAELGWRAAPFDPQLEGRRQRLAAQRGAPPDALHHAGAFGIEPALYVLGPDATTVAAKAAHLHAAIAALPAKASNPRRTGARKHSARA